MTHREKLTAGQRLPYFFSDGGTRKLVRGPADAAEAKSGTETSFGQQATETVTKVGALQTHGSPMFFGSDMSIIASQAIGPSENLNAGRAALLPADGGVG